MSLIDELKFTREEVLEKLCERIYKDTFNIREDGEEPDFDIENRIRSDMNKAIVGGIDAAVKKIGAELIDGKVESLVRGLTIERTNEYGERKGGTTTFVEYLVNRAENYMTEKVDYNGCSKSEARDSYNWSGHSTRIAHHIDKHLQFHIEAAMKTALANANSTIAAGITDAIKLELEKILKTVKASVSIAK
jgi:hypothetical protein